MNYNDFQNKLDSIQYSENRFKLWMEDGRTVMVLSPSRVNDPKGTISMMRSVYKSVLELDWKIKVSLSIAAVHILKDDENVNYCLPTDYSRKVATYYIENALFRLTSLWDMLAQGYRVLYDVKKNLKGKKIDIDHVKYKNFLIKQKRLIPILKMKQIGFLTTLRIIVIIGPQMNFEIKWHINLHQIYFTQATTL